MLYGSDERLSGSECLAFGARPNARRKSVRRNNVARFSRPLGALGGPMPHTFVLRLISHRDTADLSLPLVAASEPKLAWRQEFPASSATPQTKVRQRNNENE